MFYLVSNNRYKEEIERYRRLTNNMKVDLRDLVGVYNN